jgi:hypothetical protein
MKYVIPAFVLAAGLLVINGTGYAKPADTKKTGQKCTVCHTSAKGGKTDLNAVGKFYKEKGTLEGYKGEGADKIVEKK